MRWLLLILFCLSFGLHAQQEPANYKAATKELKQAYNEGSYTRFRLMLSDLVEEEIPMQEMAAVFDALKPTYGLISSFHFLGIDAQGARYTVRFQKGALDVVVLLDNSNKVSRLEFERYRELINAAGSNTKRN